VESDPTNPINVYGQSKLLGEAKVLSACPDAIVTRVSWVFGPDKPGFPEWLIAQVREREEVSVPSDKVACPTYSEDYAELVESLLTGPLPDGGVLHLCNAGATSWFDYAQRIVKQLQEMGQELAVRELQPARSSGVQRFVAPRPLNTAMSVEAFTRHTGFAVPGWEDAVERYIRSQFG
jgi:dTDP-4-dehydrorhamnose reductase